MSEYRDIVRTCAIQGRIGDAWTLAIIFPPHVTTEQAQASLNRRRGEEYLSPYEELRVVVIEGDIKFPGE
jgi:hypothetical protein